MIKYDGMPEPEKKKNDELNEDEMIGFIMRNVSDEHSLTFKEVQAVLDAETVFLKEKGFIE